MRSSVTRKMCRDRKWRMILVAKTITTTISRFIMVLFIILSLFIRDVQCRTLTPYCHLEGRQVLEATFNKASGELSLVNRDEENRWKDRSLQSSISSSKNLQLQSQHNNYFHGDPSKSATQALSATRLLIEEQISNNNASPTNSTNNGADNETMVEIQVRECFCSSKPSGMTIYCPIEFDICDVRDELKGKTACYTPQSSEIVTNTFPFILLSYIFLAALLVLTLKGKQIRTYLYRLCCMSKERRDQAVRDQVDYIVVQQPAVASSITRRYRRRQQDAQFRALRRQHLLESAPPIVQRLVVAIRRNPSRNDEDQELPGALDAIPSFTGVGLEQYVDEAAAAGRSQGRPTELILRTKRYTSSSSNSDRNDEKQLQQAEDEPSRMNECDQCSICLGQFVEGERIGALSCQHEFHVDCLKSWLKQKNACPLCQKPNVATIRFTSSSLE
mmetsp:Transcript_18526/g.28597  ORF Transcript_18526/g.28597 Transcript_18526/m.28597 type:complete len:445 (-) Transcript_18526:52-1386(-)